MKKRISLILTMVLVVMLAMVGCSSKETTIKDREGKDVKVPDKIDRIISAVPSGEPSSTKSKSKLPSRLITLSIIAETFSFSL